MASLSLLVQLWICQFFSFGQSLPESLDVDPSNLWKYACHFPPDGAFLVLNWLGIANLPVPLNPFSLAANLPPWIFFTTYAPTVSTLALLAMAAFLREMELPRPAALFGGVVYAWQGDILPFVFPGHYGYITTWPFFALAAWAALRSQRTRQWVYAAVAGACCGLMVGLQPDRGSIASLLIAALFAVPALKQKSLWPATLGRVALCAGLALLISLAAFLALFQSFIVGVKLGGKSDRKELYQLVTQFSLGPEETLTYLVPGFFGWSTSGDSGPYWGRIGERADWPKKHQGSRNLNLAISTTGTIATFLALIGASMLLPGACGNWLGPNRLTERQYLYGRLLLWLGLLALLLSWGYHTPLYRPLFALPLMDKWRNPLKWIGITNFALVTLSALGAQQVIASLDAAWEGAVVVRRRLFLAASSLLLILGLGFLLSFPLAFLLAAYLQSVGSETGLIVGAISMLHTSLFVATVLMALFCLLLKGLWQPEWLLGWQLENPWLHRIWQAALQPATLALTLSLGLSLLCVMQMAWVAKAFIRTDDLETLTGSNALLEQLKTEGNTVRVSVANEDPLLNILLQNQFAADGISCLDISAASRIPDDLAIFFHTLDKDEPRLWLLAGVKNVVVPQEYIPRLRANPQIAADIDHADGYILEPTDSPDLPSHALIQIRDYLSKATLVSGAEVIAGESDLLKRLQDPAWNPRATVLLGAPVSAAPNGAEAAPSNISPQSDVKLVTYNQKEIKLTVRSAQGGYILINDQYDPDWKVELNGHPAPLLRADYILRAVAVPPGESKITMRYVAHYHVAGWDLPARLMNNFSDGVMIATWVIAGLALWWRKRGVTVL